MAYVRTVQTASGATAVQIVHSSRRGSRSIEHPGSARDEKELQALKAAARASPGGKASSTSASTPGAAAVVSAGPLQIESSQMRHLADALSRAYDAPGSDDAAGGDGVFRQLVLARIIEPDDRVIHGRSPAHRWHRGRGRRDGVRSKPQRPRWRRPELHHRRADSRGPLPGEAVARGPPRHRGLRRARLHPTVAAGASKAKGRRNVVHYQYLADRARRSLRGIEEQVAKAEQAAAERVPSSGTGS